MTSSRPVTREHAILRQLATRLGQLHADDAEILNLATSLYQIGCGIDANVALRVRRSKGHDDKKAEAHYLTQRAIRWIAGLMNPIDGEKPPKKSIAIAHAANAFGLDVDNLTRACPNKQRLTEMATFDWNSQRPLLNKPRD